MSEAVIRTDSVLVGPEIVGICLDFSGKYSMHLDIGGFTYKVLGVSGTPDTLVVSYTPTPAGDLEWEFKVLPNSLKYSEKFTIYCVESAPTLAGEL